jgi:hypothetical protein
MCSSGNHQKHLNCAPPSLRQVSPVHLRRHDSTSSQGSAGGLLLQNPDSLTYTSLLQFWRRGIRNRSWGRLSIAERGLYRCTLWLAKARGKITNSRLMVHVLRVALKLRQSLQSRIARAGKARAAMMFEEYGRPGECSAGLRECKATTSPPESLEPEPVTASVSAEEKASA